MQAQHAVATRSALSVAPKAKNLTMSGPVSEQLAFRIGAEEYCVDILCVQEIRGYAEPTRIANAPAFIKGVLDLRGTIVPIVDLRMKFGVHDVRYDSLTVTIVLSIGSRVIGVVVDGVSDVLQLPADQIRPAPEFSRSAVESSHITGIATLGGGGDGRMLILLDIAAFLSSAEFGLFEAAA